MTRSGIGRRLAALEKAKGEAANDAPNVIVFIGVDPDGSQSPALAYVRTSGGLRYVQPEADETQAAFTARCEAIAADPENPQDKGKVAGTFKLSETSN